MRGLEEWEEGDNSVLIVVYFIKDKSVIVCVYADEYFSSTRLITVLEKNVDWGYKYLQNELLIMLNQMTPALGNKT